MRTPDWHRASRKKTAWSDHHRKPLFMVLSSQTATSTEVETWLLSPFTRACSQPLLAFRADVATNMRVMVTPFTRALTFRALHGNHIVSIPFQTIVKKRPERFRPQMSSPDIHPPPPHDMQFACLSPSFLKSLIPMFFLYFLYLPDTIEQFKT